MTFLINTRSEVPSLLIPWNLCVSLSWWRLETSSSVLVQFASEMFRYVSVLSVQSAVICILILRPEAWLWRWTCTTSKFHQLPLQLGVLEYGWYLETQWFLLHLQIKSSQLRIHAGGEHILHFEYLYSCRKTSHQCQQGNLTLELQVAS